MAGTGRNKKAKWYFYLIVGVFLLIWIVPILMMFSVSFMPPDVRAPAFGGLFLPSYSLQNYKTVFEDVPMLRYLLNSIIVTVPSVVLVMLFSSMAAYAFSRLRFIGRNLCFSLLLITLMLPIPTLVIPLFQINKMVHLYNTYFGLILPYIALGIPFAVVIFRGFFESFPGELEDAARIDGCTAWSIYRNVIMPVSGPAISVVIIWQSMKSWNEFLLALVTIESKILKTLPLVPFIYNGQYMANPGAMFAVLVLMSIPVILVYIVMQRYIVSGLTSGALKG